ncbi:hypothetical protein GGX14DRAFT_568166 [Mycena pura]|uniref:Uncharacterized protein n=1 Tax=Mycena pura TaxID=153505 RepID=A0AAD6Y858_9AGAR|nr:hypothetical protein GGX14DRAFT_568166 [Mycena pura]
MLFAVNPPTDPGSSYLDFARNAHRDAIITAEFTTNGIVRTAYASPVPNSVTDGSAVTTTADPNATGASQTAIPISVFADDGVVATLYGFTSGLQGTSTTGSESSVAPTQSRVFGPPASLRTSASVPVAAIVGSVIGVMVLLSLCLVAILVRCRRRRRLRAHRYELGPGTESGTLQEHLNESRAYEEPRSQSEKGQTHKWSRVDPESSVDRSTLPTAVRDGLATMMEEMQVLRTQMQRIEMERQPSGFGRTNEPPPQYTAQQ